MSDRCTAPTANGSDLAKWVKQLHESARLRSVNADLLAALEDLVNHLDDDECRGNCKEIHIARAAIKRAKGKA